MDLSEEDESVFGLGSRNKPCRTCTDFKTWTKIQQGKVDAPPQNLTPVQFSFVFEIKCESCTTDDVCSSCTVEMMQHAPRKASLMYYIVSKKEY